MKQIIAKLQPMGRALMLPIAVLPVAALLLRLGQPDLLNMPAIAAAGDAIVSNLGLLFAIGVAVGLARENHGAAGLGVRAHACVPAIGQDYAVTLDCSASGGRATFALSGIWPNTCPPGYPRLIVDGNRIEFECGSTTAVVSAVIRSRRGPSLSSGSSHAWPTTSSSISRPACWTH